jgi:hypothetical protein
MRNVLAIAALSAFAVACGPDVAAEARLAALDDWCGSHFCMPEATVFTAAGEGLGELLRDSVERYARATGRDLSTDPQAGIPVIWVDSPKGEDGKRVCGTTTRMRYAGSQWFTQVIKLDPHPVFCPPPATTLLHELIHALGPDSEHLEDSGYLFSDGVGHSTGIDEPSLTRLCENFACASFEPEQGVL